MVPIGIVVASNAFNMVAGYNGLEAGMGVIIFSALGYVAFMNRREDAAALSLMMVCTLLAFLYYNWYPAKVFPGDSMTYSVGALTACVAILGDMEKIAVVLFVPYALDFFLQLRGSFSKEAFAEVREDGSLGGLKDGVYHLTHLAIAVLKRLRGRVYERDVVVFVCGIEVLTAVLALAMWLKKW
ncbi:MAG: hypothetical protein QUS09_01290 [Methanotrichaceae archaeon]|nr:hypothetical protein [Methanotrichaceae archaeon]